MQFSSIVKTLVSVSALTFTLSNNAIAEPAKEKPILIVGASYENALTPLNDNLEGPFFGWAAFTASYLSLGNALIRNEDLSGFVINEAQAGATTFERLRCGPTFCLPWGWEGMDTQLERALKRVAILDAYGNVLGYNADYLIIGLPNDCQHSGAMGIPHVDTDPCDLDDLNGVVDRLRDVAQTAVDKGLTPIFNRFPDYSALDFETFKNNFGMKWVIDEATWNQLNDLIYTRIQTEVPETIFVDAWADFTPMEGDGTHPNYETSRQAAKRIVKAMQQHQN